MRRNYAIIPALIILLLFSVVFFISNAVKEDSEVTQCENKEGYYWDSNLDLCAKNLSEVKEISEVIKKNITKKYSTDDVQIKNYSKASCENCFSFNVKAKDKNLIVSTKDNEIQNIEEIKQGNYCTEPRPEICTREYMPVCGYFNDSIKCIRAPCAATYSNKCSACSDSKVEYWEEGECDE